MAQEFTTEGGLGLAHHGGIFEESATALHKLGTRLRVGQRVFHYAKNGAAALVAGNLVTGVVAPEVEKSVSAAVAIGDTSLTVVTAAANANLAEGWMNVNKGTGMGHTYKIKSSVANATTATSTDITLYDPIKVALVASGTSEVTLHYNDYYAVVKQASASIPVVGAAPFAVTANYYFWLPTWGPACVTMEDTPAINAIITTDGTAFGQGATDAAASIGQQYGRMMGHTGVDDENSLVYLMLAP